MTGGRWPFTLQPLPGEAFETWLHSYAARLALTPNRLIDALDLTGALGQVLRGRWQRTQPDQRTIAAIAAAAGLDPQAVQAMFDAPGHVPPHATFIAWAPRTTGRFCPSCVAQGRWSANWRLRLQFFCHDHRSLLADLCPGCRYLPVGSPARPELWPGSPATSPNPPFTPTHCRCGQDLRQARPPQCADPDAAATAQRSIDTLLTTIRDPTCTPDQRQEALDTLNDVSLIAAHAAADGRGKQTAVSAPVLRAEPLTTAVAIFNHDRGATSPDPLLDLVESRAPQRRTRGTPHTWVTGSPSLRTRIVYGRTESMTAVDRLRRATSLPTPRTLPHRRAGQTDPAIARAPRLPDQIWPVWAIRLGQDTGRQGATFGPAALVALLLPHSTLLLKPTITALVNPAIQATTVAHHMVRLLNQPTGTTALRVLTELAFAIDDHDIPIDYAHRRRLFAGTRLIDDDTWQRVAPTRTGRGQHTRNADRYLYELLTGGHLAIAAPPHQLTGSDARRDQYRDFADFMPLDVRDALHTHAHQLLRDATITDEPLTWEPPTDWVTTTDWPGTDPDDTDPAEIHHAILDRRVRLQHVADDLGLTIEHVRAVLHRHPLPQAVSTLPLDHRVIAPPGRPPNRRSTDPVRVDPAWLREQHHTWQRSLADIAAEIGCNHNTLGSFAHTHAIAVRPSGGSGNINRHATGGRHPSQLPQPLRDALHGTGALLRLERFVTLAHQPSINQTAQAVGCSAPNLLHQLDILEHAAGGHLLQRSARSRRGTTLTPLGQDLCHQAQEHLGITPILPTTRREPP
ncbi:TniQ family protein [Antribacter gilvus]|uniref:TniQ family protein n=1 Tax=Antribacter gilvus TaxID=2304675 RepID=UPI000F78747A|nr:TniQ family protein [Antribacter gilvus]